MNVKFRKYLAMGLAGITAAACVLTGCGSGGSSSSDDADHFDVLTVGSVSSVFLDDYGDNPAVQRWLGMDWDVDGESKQITIDFTTPPDGTETDYMNTIMATGEYPDMIPLSYASDNAATLYDQGIILDITDYVEQYMPNYMAWLDEHPTYKSQVTIDVDGERRMVGIYCLADQAEDAWGGYVYRRDWIVKYGTNPETGEPFEGGYDDDGNWSDNVVFPCGETDPYYISDWEWMFEIFQTAIDTEGITEGYAVQLPYQGYVGTGDLATGFGANIGYAGYGFDEEGVVHEYVTSDNARAYLQCMNNWYEKGWVNQDFEENTSDTMWFSVDAAHTYTGQVGLWYGLVSQLDGNMATGEDDYTQGIFVSAAAQPINDVYGDASCQGIEPTQFYETSLISAPFALTNKAEDKDIAALLTAFDYLYGREGGLLRYYGFTDKQVAEYGDDEILSLYKEYDIDGTIYDNGDDTYVRNQKVNDVDGLQVALNMVRLPGTSIFVGVDQGYTETYGHSIEQMNMYDASASLGTLTDQLSADDSTKKSSVDTQLTTYLPQIYGDFITGRTDIDDDSAWADYVQTCKDYGIDEIVDILNAAAGN